MLENVFMCDWSWLIIFFFVIFFYVMFGVICEWVCFREILLFIIIDVISIFYMVVMIFLVISFGCICYCFIFGVNVGLVICSILWVFVCNVIFVWFVIVLLKVIIRYYDVVVFCWWCDGS